MLIVTSTANGSECARPPFPTAQAMLRRDEPLAKDEASEQREASHTQYLLSLTATDGS